MKFSDGSILICDGEPGLSEAFAGTLAIELPQEDFKYVSEEEKDYIEEQMEKTEAVIDPLIGIFKGEDMTWRRLICDGKKSGCSIIFTAG